MFTKLRRKLAEWIAPDDWNVIDGRLDELLEEDADERLDTILGDADIDQVLDGYPVTNARLIDLTRQALKLHPIDVMFKHDEGLYADKQYQRAAADVLDNPAFKYEFNRVLHECVMYIAVEAPNQESSTFNRGAIDGLVRLQNRLNDHKVVIEQERLDNREKAAEEQ